MLLVGVHGQAGHRPASSGSEVHVPLRRQLVQADVATGYKEEGVLVQQVEVFASSAVVTQTFLQLQKRGVAVRQTEGLGDGGFGLELGEILAECGIQ